MLELIDNQNKAYMLGVQAREQGLSKDPRDHLELLSLLPTGKLSDENVFMGRLKIYGAFNNGYYTKDKHK